MKVSFEDAGPCRKTIHIDAPADEIRSEYEEVVGVFSQMGQVPGFRQGKAPKQIVERQYARRIAEEVKDRLLPKLYRKAVEQEKVNPVAVVDVADVTLDRQRGLHFRVTVDIPPDFELPKYTKVSLKSQPVEVTEEHVSKAVEHLLEEHARYEDVSGRPAAAGDLAKIDYEGECEGKRIEEMARSLPGVGKGRDFWAFIGEPEFLPGFGKALVGVAVGEERTVNVGFPGDYRVPALAGKTGKYVVQVKGIREKVSPKLDKDFLDRFKVDSEASLRQKMREDLTKIAEANERNRLKEEIAGFLLEKADFDLPQTVVEHETSQMIQNIVRRTVMGGASRDDIEKQRDMIVSTATRSSTEKVKLSYILSRIADEESIAVSDSDVEARMQAVASRYGMPFERLKAEMEKNNAVEKLKSDIRAEKTMDFLLEHAKVKK